MNPDTTSTIGIMNGDLYRSICLLIAGATVQWFVKFMANNQEAQTKLREALRSTFPGDSLPDVTDLITRDVPYLNATIEETIRCAGTVGRILRVATTDTEIFGHKIPAGTQITALTTSRWHPAPVPEEQRSPTSRAALEKSGGADWTRKPNAQDLEKFAPERWFKIDENGDEVFDSNAMIQNAFGGGARGCFGKFELQKKDLLGPLYCANADPLCVPRTTPSYDGATHYDYLDRDELQIPSSTS